MYVVEKEMKVKIKKFIAKFATTIKDFSLLEFLLMRNIENRLKSIDSKNGLIDHYNIIILDAQATIDVSKEKIIGFMEEITDLKNKIKDIEKI